MLIHSLQLLCTTHSFVLVSYIHNETLCTLFFWLNYFFLTFTTYFYVSPQRLCTSTDDEQHHAMHTRNTKMKKIIHCFDPKNGCFAIHVPTTTELWTNFELDWTFSSITLVRWVLMCTQTCQKWCHNIKLTQVSAAGGRTNTHGK